MGSLELILKTLPCFKLLLFPWRLLYGLYPKPYTFFCQTLYACDMWKMFTYVEEDMHVTPIEEGQIIIEYLHFELITLEKCRVSGTIFCGTRHDCGALDYQVSWDRQAWRIAQFMAQMAPTVVGDLEWLCTNESSYGVILLFCFS